MSRSESRSSSAEGSRNSSDNDDDDDEQRFHQQLHSQDNNSQQQDRSSLEEMLRSLNLDSEGWSPYEGDLENLGTLVDQAINIMQRQ